MNVLSVLKTVGNWLKDNWLIVALSLFVVYMYFSLTSQQDLYNQLTQKYIEQSEDYQQQLEKLQEIQEKEYQELQRIRRLYEEKTQDLKEQYKQSIEQIEKGKKTEQKKIVRETKKDPNSLMKKYRDEFGIPYDGVENE